MRGGCCLLASEEMTSPTPSVYVLIVHGFVAGDLAGSNVGVKYCHKMKFASFTTERRLALADFASALWFLRSIRICIFAMWGKVGQLTAACQQLFFGEDAINVALPNEG